MQLLLLGRDRLVCDCWRRDGWRRCCLRLCARSGCAQGDHATLTASNVAGSDRRKESVKEEVFTRGQAVGLRFA